MYSMSCTSLSLFSVMCVTTSMLWCAPNGVRYIEMCEQWFCYTFTLFVSFEMVSGQKLLHIA